MASPVGGSVTISITAQNDAPVDCSGTLTLHQAVPTRRSSDLAPTDVDGNLLTILVTGLPSKGVVYLADGTTAVVSGQTLTASQLTGLLFRPNADASASAGSFVY